MTTDTMTHKKAIEAYELAVKRLAAAKHALEVAQKNHLELIGAADAALDQPDKAMELAEATARQGHLVETHREMLEAAERRLEDAGFAVLPFAAQKYRATEAENRKWLEDYDARSNELLQALIDHTENESWLQGRAATPGRVGGFSPGPKKRARVEAAWIAGRAARFIEIVMEGREEELVAELQAQYQKQLRQPQFLGNGLADDPFNRDFGRRTPLSALPAELKPGGYYPIYEDN